MEEYFRTHSGSKKAHQMIVDKRKEIRFEAQNFEMDSLNEELALLTTDQELWSWVHNKIVHESQGKFIHSPNYAKVVNMAFERLSPNPHLALALFHLVSTTSSASYVSGITAPLYFNLCKLRWTTWLDVQGVEETVSAMVASGIGIEWNIRSLVHQIRQAIEADLFRAEDQLFSVPYFSHLIPASVDNSEPSEELRMESDKRCRFSKADRKSLERLEQLLAEAEFQPLSDNSFDDYNAPRRPRNSYTGPPISVRSLRSAAVEEFDGPLWENKRHGFDDFIDEMELDPPVAVRQRRRNAAFQTSAATHHVGLRGSSRAFSTSALLRSPKGVSDEAEESKSESEWGFERPPWAGKDARRNKYLEEEQDTRGMVRKAQSRVLRSLKHQVQPFEEDHPDSSRSQSYNSFQQRSPDRHKKDRQIQTRLGIQLSPEEKAKEDSIWSQYTTPQLPISVSLTPAKSNGDDAANREVYNKYVRESEGVGSRYRKALWQGAEHQFDNAHFREATQAPRGAIYKRARRNLTAKEKARFDEPHPLLAWKAPFDKAALKKKLSKSGRAPIFRKEKSIWEL